MKTAPIYDVFTLLLMLLLWVCDWGEEQPPLVLLFHPIWLNSKRLRDSLIDNVFVLRLVRREKKMQIRRHFACKIGGFEKLNCGIINMHHRQTDTAARGFFQKFFLFYLILKYVERSNGSKKRLKFTKIAST